MEVYHFIILGLSGLAAYLYHVGMLSKESIKSCKSENKSLKMALDAKGYYIKSIERDLLNLNNEMQAQDDYIKVLEAELDEVDNIELGITPLDSSDIVGDFLSNLKDNLLQSKSDDELLDYLKHTDNEETKDAIKKELARRNNI